MTSVHTPLRKGTRAAPDRDTQRWVQSTGGKPPTHVTPALARARRLWYASNPWRPDWQANSVALRAASDCLREKGHGTR